MVDFCFRIFLVNFIDFKKSSKAVLVDDIHEQIIIHNDVKQEPLFDKEEGKELIKPVDNDYARTLIQYELEKYKIVKGKPNRIVFWIGSKTSYIDVGDNFEM